MPKRKPGDRILIGRIIEWELNSRGLTQEQAAELFGLNSRQTVRRIFNGQASVGEERLRNIERVLNELTKGCYPRGVLEWLEHGDIDAVMESSAPQEMKDWWRQLWVERLEEIGLDEHTKFDPWVEQIVDLPASLRAAVDQERRERIIKKVAGSRRDVTAKQEEKAIEVLRERGA